MKQNSLLTDVGAERVVLASIIQRGANGLIDIQEILDTDDFYTPYGRRLFSIFKSLVHEQNISKFDIPIIVAASKKLNMNPIINESQDEEFLDALSNEQISNENAIKLATQIYTLRICRDAWHLLAKTRKSIETITGTEKIDDVISLIENPVFDFTSKIINKEHGMIQIGNDYDLIMDQILKDPKDIVGIASGFPKWDHLIGGGLRPSSVNIVGARAKRGKSYFCLNVGYNVAKQGIPVLYLDTELSRKDQMTRLSSLISKVEFNRIESGQFGGNEPERNAVLQISDSIKNLPIMHYNIAGFSTKSILSIIRRWIIKNVGTLENGSVNPCLIIYDYIKLMDSEDISKSMQEYQALGFLMAQLHNFALSWGAPILATVQLNREGVKEPGGATLAGSDRILWLCTSCTILRDKDNEDLQNDPPSNGNKQLIITDTRFGPGMTHGDYINIQSDLSRSSMVEGPLFSEILTNKAVAKNEPVH